MSSVVLALLGTDHHPFDRLVDWMDLIATEHPQRRVIVQYGHSAAPTFAEGRPFFSHDELVELVREADVVVCHGGPGTIMDAKGEGHVPVCVPRDPSRGEHVDDHQMRFARMAQGAGMVELALTVTETVDAISRAMARRRLRVRTVDQDATARFAHEVDDVVGRRVRRSHSVRRALFSRVAR